MAKATEKELRALQIIADCPCTLGIQAKQFGEQYFTSPEHQYLFTSLSNQGEGACYGKKAWRCAGAILGKLAKKGYVRFLWNHYHITELGRELLTNHD